jgi:STE24 endopeptidase
LVGVSKNATYPYFNDITQALVFIAICLILADLRGFSWTLYNTFEIKDRHGFNKMSIGLFWKDYIKKCILLIVIGVPIFYFLMSLIEWGGQHFYIYVFIFVLVVFFLMLLLVPTCIMPIFNKYTPLNESFDLYHEIRNLSEKEQFPLK